MLIQSSEYQHGFFEVYSEPPTFEMVRVKQIHSAIIVTSEQADFEADGISFSFQNKKNLCIVTADCLPILMLHDHGGFLLHAGWRGLDQEIYLDPHILKENIYTIEVGPYIHGESYQVGAEFLDYFGQGPWLKSYNNSYYFDQSVWFSHKVQEHYPNAKLRVSDKDTFNHPKLHSFRREKQSCRNYNIWRPKL